MHTPTMVAKRSMEKQAAVDFISSLPRERKAKFCASLCRELTIIARAGYDLPDRSLECARLRAVNEIQHRMTAILDELLDGEREDHDERIVWIFLGQRDDRYLQELLRWAFERVARPMA